MRSWLDRARNHASHEAAHTASERTMMKTTAARTGLLIIVVLMMIAGGGGPTSAQSGPVKIGFIYPGSGPMAQLGLDLRDGFQLYWSEVGNKAGGRPVEVLVERKA